MTLTRRSFLGGAFAAIASARTAVAASADSGDPGPLVADPEGILDLPPGFRYSILARPGEAMDDGLVSPHRPDGMAAFARRDGKLALIRNHELHPAQTERSAADGDPARLLTLDRRLIYDAGGGRSPGCGGTSTLVLDPRSLERERMFLSLAGTEQNCAGGPMAWNAWLSCEEAVPLAGRYDCRTDGGGWSCEALAVDASAGGREILRDRDHGYIFEVPADADEPAAPVPLTAMGRFYHEAAALDPRTGIIYLTEDRHDGLLYRFVPEQPGNLREGGRLEALAIRGEPSRETSNAAGSPPLPQGRWLAVEWLPLDEVEAPDDDLRYRGFERGAARFVRGEGAWFGDGELVFSCTEGGRRGLGQLFRYRPSPAEGKAGEAEEPGRLVLFVEADRRSVMQNCDNLTVSPWGDLVVAEDAPDNCRLLGVTPEGRIYELARNAYTDSELAGVCFSPDGRYLFVNIQEQGFTLAIAGPWPA